MNDPGASVARSLQPSPQPARALLSTADHRALVAGYRELLPIGPGVEPGLAAALRDVLDHPGNMIRAQLAFGLMLAGGSGHEPALRLATALEYFHAASLVFDDLPAMDDATLRRGRLCPHRIWGDGIAILAALALVNRAYELSWSVIGALPARRRREAADLLGSSLGLEGILGGQARDLRFDAAAEAAAEVVAVAEGKTVSLVRLTLVLPAVAAGAPRRTRDGLSRLALAWGMAYQILDDFRDELAPNRSEDVAGSDDAPWDRRQAAAAARASIGPTGKTGHRDGLLGRPNLPRHTGPLGALDALRSHLARARSLIARFPASYPPARLLERVQSFLEDEASRVAVALGSTGVR